MVKKLNILFFSLKNCSLLIKRPHIILIFFYSLFTLSPSSASLKPHINHPHNPVFGIFQTHDNLKLRTAKWPALKKAKGTIILVQGMGGFIEAYDSFAQWLSQNGFDVLSFDLRGQGDSDRITNKETLLHINSFDEYIKDLKNFIKEQKNLIPPLVLIGTSMGGNIALRYVHEIPQKADALILLSPMIDINTSPYPYPIARSIASIALMIGAGENFVLGYDSFSLQTCINKYNPNKHGCPNKYHQDCRMLHEKPNMAIGGPSYNWLSSAFQSCDVVREEMFTKNLSLPILMVSVTNDHLVDTQAQIELCGAIPSCKQILYEDGHHNILKDNDNVFQKLSSDILAFLHETLNL